MCSSRSYAKGASRRSGAFFFRVVATALVVSLLLFTNPAMGGGERKVTTNGNRIIVELANEDLIPGNLFDLEDTTIRFTPQGAGYRGEIVPFQWDPDFGSVIRGYPSIEMTLTSPGAHHWSHGVRPSRAIDP